MNSATPAEPTGPATTEFYRRLDDIEARAKAVGLTMTHICRGAGIARATPDRWRKEPPLSIKLLDKMDEYVSGEEKGQPQ